jgi:hypothetical protein
MIRRIFNFRATQIPARAYSDPQNQARAGLFPGLSELLYRVIRDHRLRLCTAMQTAALPLHVSPL